MTLTLAALPWSPLGAQSGISNPSPTGAYFNGVFPSLAPGSGSGLTTVNAFPNLRFIGPLWVTTYPGRNDLVVVGKSGHVWRFPYDPNDPDRFDVTPSEVTVMLNYSKYGDGVDTPENVLPDGDHEPAVVDTPLVPSAPDMAFYHLTFHPNFGQSGMTGENHVFASYSHVPDLPGSNNDQYTYFRVSRFNVINQATDPIIDPTSEVVLIDQFDRDRNHQGGAMFFGDDGFLYISTGDGGFFYSNGTSERISQRLEGALMGGILRIDVDMQGPPVSHAIPLQPNDAAMKHSSQIPAGWPASSSANYMIPSDNPWVGNSGVLEEFWSVGLRSPHTMQRDPVTGQIWIGDVGGSDEEIHLAAAGGNYGWDFTNGGGEPKPSPLIGSEEPAILKIGSGRCVIGGYIYRDSQFPELDGKLLFGDHVQGTVSALTYNPGGSSTSEFLCDFPRIGGGSKQGLANFCRGPAGEVFMPDLGGFVDATDIEDNDGTIQILSREVITPDPPALLSETGAFLDLATLSPHPSFLPYGVLNPLWSDASDKGRWIALPNDGKHDTPAEKITFSENGNWMFPAGTVLMKHFELPIDDDDPTLTTRLETRFIVCLPGGDKYGFTYRWRPDQSDADLLIAGATGDYTINQGEPDERTQTWAFPSRSDCILCHNNASGQALGVRTHQLNGYYLYPDSGIEANQLLTWSGLGMFDQTLTANQVADFIQSRALGDTTAPIEHRVRSYFDSNCSHCHRPGGPGGNFDSRLTTPLLGQNIINQSPNFFQDLAPDGRYIKPGDVPNSIFHYRMDHALPDSAAMPPLAKNLVDPDAVQETTDWINALNPADFPATPTFLRPYLAGPATTTGDFVVTVVFDDDVSGLTDGDFSFNNGRILGIDGSGHYYRVHFRPSGSPLSFSLPGGAVTGDNTGLTNTGSTAIIVTFNDTEPPEAEFINLPPGDELTGPVTIGIDFGKDVTGFSLGDLSVTNGSVSTLIPGNGAYFFDLTPTGPGEVVINLAAAAVQDSQSRPNAAASLTLQSVEPDADNDGIPDADEATYGTDINNPDSDGDGLSDGDEVNLHGTDPTDADSDNDGFDDFTEIFAGSDPNQGADIPAWNAPSSLVSYYNFDEGSGDDAFDTAVSGSAQTATENQGSVQWDNSNPLIGSSALDLNGSTSLAVNVPFDGSTTEYTMCVWLKSDAFSTTREGIFNHRGSSNDVFWGIAVVPGTGGSDYRIRSNNGGVSVPDNTFGTGVWQHVAWTWSSATREAKIYIDGVLQSTAVNVSDTYNATENTWRIGDDSCCGGREMNGRLDDLAIFDEVLSDDQIAQIHQGGLKGLPVSRAFTDAPFLITSQTMAANGEDFYLNWNSEPGATYSILSSTDLSIPRENWQVLFNSVASAGPTTSYLIDMSLLPDSDSRRFFVILRNP
ncbi:MAG: LamG-like jellyroll fold domain-containing protein [Verrucomicrobiota bacterium]